MKRKEIISAAEAHIELNNKNIAFHMKERAAALKRKDEAAASYHWGRASGLGDGNTIIRVLIEHLEKKES